MLSRTLGLGAGHGLKGGASTQIAFNTSLVAHWTLDEENGARADSGPNGLTLTDNNAVLSDVAVLGNGALFSAASSQFLSRAHHADLSIVDELTISCLVKFETLPTESAYYVVISKYTAEVGKLEWILSYEATQGKFRFYTGAGGSTVFASTTPIITGVWYHVVARVKNGVAVSICVNGSASKVTAAMGTEVAGDSPLFIGKIAWLEGEYDGFLDGLVDDVRIWKRRITDAEVDYLYHTIYGL